jgi:hypothetical protein
MFESTSDVRFVRIPSENSAVKHTNRTLEFENQYIDPSSVLQTYACKELRYWSAITYQNSEASGLPTGDTFNESFLIK